MSLYQLNIGYAALLTAGGLIGFISKADLPDESMAPKPGSASTQAKILLHSRMRPGSLPSLAAGAGSGLLVAGFTHFNWPYKTLAVTAISAGLAYVMGNKFQATQKFMPAGLIALTSVVVFLAQARQWYISGSPQ